MIRFIVGYAVLTLSILPLKAQEKRASMETLKEQARISCKLTTPELQKRKATVIAELKALVLSRKELTNGYAYEFNGTDEILDKLNAFIKTERMCCDFFTFQLTIEENKALLNIIGPEGTKEFLKQEVDL